MLVASGAATRGDAKALEEWRARSAAHEAAFREASRLYRAIRIAGERMRADEVQPTGGFLERTLAAPAAMPRRQLLQGAMAASAAGIGVLFGGQSLGLWGGEQSAQFVTRKGEQKVVQLGDGARIELNTDTRLSRRPDLGERSVELFGGEVMLTVPHRGRAPAVVLAGAGRTVSNGGRIALRCRDDSVSVTCLAGAVAVQIGGVERGVLPGQQLRYDDRGFGEIASVDLEMVTAWRNGTLVFRRARVDEVIDEIGRYRDGRIVIANPSLAGRRIDGTFHMRNVDQIFDQLKSVYGTSVTHLPGGLVLLT